MKKQTNIIFLILFLAFIFLIPIRTVIGPHSEISFYEQRKLKPVPEASKETLWNGAYFSDIEASLKDNIAYREDLIRLNTEVDMSLKKPVINDIIISSDVLLDYYGYIYWDISNLPKLAEKVGGNYSRLNEEIKSYGGYFCFLGLPLQSSYFSNHYPAFADNRLWHITGTREAFFHSLESNKVPFIDMHTVFENLEYPSSYYLKTDHHFAFEGAFISYSELMNKISEETDFKLKSYKSDELEWDTLPNPFLGSENRKLNNLWVNNEKLKLARLQKPIPFTRIDNGEVVDSSVFSVPNNNSDIVTYSLYMGGDIGETIIKTNRPELPNLLIFGDSFTNPIESLIWTGFNETRSLDMRYYSQYSLSDYVKKYHPDVVVCVRDESVYLLSEGNGKLG